MKRAMLVALFSLTLAACGAGTGATPTPSPLNPGDITPTGAPQHLRRDLGNSIVAAKAEHGSDDGRAIYVTHVPTGAQVVLDRDGNELERYDGDGMTLIEAALAGDGVRADLGSMLDTPGPDRDRCVADYVPAMEFGGVHYLTARLSGSTPEISQDLLGEMLYRVAFRLDCSGTGLGYQAQDGDATFLAPGTPVYAVRGYDPSFRLAIHFAGKMALYEATDNPAAVRGEDLLDIRGKVSAIDVMIEPPSFIVVTTDDGGGRSSDGEILATIGDPRAVEESVAFVLDAPVHHGQTDRAFEVYFLRFQLTDGTSVVRAFWPETGELHRGIMTDPSLTLAVLWALPDGYRPEQTWDGPRITEALAIRIAHSSLPAGPDGLRAQPAHTAARFMTLGEFGALMGMSYGETIDTGRQVWAVESSLVDPATSYALAVIDADSGDYHASSHANEPRLGGSGPIPAPTATLTPTPTEER